MVTACKNGFDPGFDEGGYPEPIEKIIQQKCATSGCHNTNSAVNAAGLDLSTWSLLLRGGVTGAVVIPYNAENSPLFQFVNTYPDLGVMASPTMPINLPVLNKDEVITIKNWINAGCPNENGIIPFKENYSSRKKAYICNQGCDVVSVVDLQTMLVMRLIPVGHDPNLIELPHGIKTSWDGKYWYVCFNNGAYVQQFDALTDTLVAEAAVGIGNWNVVSVSPDNSMIYVSELSGNGKLAMIETRGMQVQQIISGPNVFASPHGIATTRNADTIYVSAQYGNMIYRVQPAIPKIDKISLQPGVTPVTTPQLLDPHEILMLPDYTKYFITCEASNEVRVMDAHTDTLLRVIPVGIYPKAITYSKVKNLIFVTCQEDNSTYAAQKAKGTVYVIDAQTLSVIKILDERFFQPHGIVVDDRSNELIVVSRNANPNGPAPHHTSSCGGRNGFFHVIDIEHWTVKKRNVELSVDPYNTDIR